MFMGREKKPFILILTTKALMVMLTHPTHGPNCAGSPESFTVMSQKMFPPTHQMTGHIL